MTVTYDQIRANEDIKVYIKKADESLAALGYTEHSFAHVTRAADSAAMILTELGYDRRTVELARIAGYLHDIGNLVNRVGHSESGALIAFRILGELGMGAEEISTVVTAIGNHDEGNGVAVNPVAAALIIADKCDVRRSRVRNFDYDKFDIHDRVNFSVVESQLSVSRDKQSVNLDLVIDSSISAVMDYFEIFLGRMQMSRSAAAALGLTFHLTVNGQMLL